MESTGAIPTINYRTNLECDPKDLDGILPALQAVSLRRARSFRASLTTVLADFARGINVGSRHDLELINREIEINRLRFDMIIDRKFPFKEAGQAFEYPRSGLPAGKVVIELSGD